MKRYAAALVVLAALIPLPGAIAGLGSPSGSDLAFYDPASGRWDLAGVDSFFYGAPGDLPLLCDWNGDGIATVGVYRDARGYLLLKDGHSTGSADYEFYYGIPGDRPVCGDWDGDGIDTISIFRPSEGRFYLRNANTQGFGQLEFDFGFENGIPFAGDWDGDGVDTVGLRDPKSGYVSIARDHHSNENPVTGYFGSAGDAIVVGDWNGDGRDRIGVHDPDAATLAVSETLANPRPTAIYDVGSRGLPLAAEFDGRGRVAQPHPSTTVEQAPVLPASETEPDPPEPTSPAQADGALYLWDTVWAIAGKADAQGMREYVERIAGARGSAGQQVTGFWFQVVNGNTPMGTPNGFGHSFGSFDAPSADYLGDIDYLLTLAHDHGLRVGIAVAWDGPTLHSVESGKLNAGNAYDYGYTLASRWTRPGFPAGDTITAWVLGGDPTEDCCGGEHAAVWSEVARGLRDGEGANRQPQIPVLFHTAPGQQLNYIGADWIDGHAPQTGHCFDAGRAEAMLRELQNDGRRNAPVWGNGEMRYENIDWTCNGRPITPGDVLADTRAMAGLGFIENFVYGHDPRWNASRPGDVGLSASGVSTGLQAILDEPGLIRSRPPLP
jgi:hypothetical protein